MIGLMLARNEKLVQVIFDLESELNELALPLSCALEMALLAALNAPTVLVKVLLLTLTISVPRSPLRLMSLVYGQKKIVVVRMKVIPLGLPL